MNDNDVIIINLLFKFLTQLNYFELRKLCIRIVSCIYLLLYSYIFNIKMINRSARKLEELTDATIDQGSARKLGNIVIRLERSTNLGPSKRDEYGGI